MDASGTPYVVYKDEANAGKATVMKFNGTSWVTVGAAGFSAGEQIQPSLAIDANGTPYVAYRDVANGYKATVMKFDGTAWVAVGVAGFSAGGATRLALALSSENVPYVAYNDETISNTIRVAKFNGTTWEAVGTTALFPPNQFYKFSFKLDANGTPYVACRTTFINDYGAVVLKFNGTDWETVGNAGFSAGEIREIALGLDAAGAPYVFYRDMANGLKATVKKYDGTAWQTVGTEAFSVNEIKEPNLVLNAAGVPVIAYLDDDYYMTPTVMKFAVSTPLAITTQPAAKTVTAGENTSFTVTATGDGISYQWQVSKDGGNSFSPINEGLGYSGVSTSTLNLNKAPVSINGYQYRVVVGNGLEVTSSPATLTVNYPTFDNSKVWQAEGQSGFSLGSASYSSLVFDANNTPYIAYQDAGYDYKATVKKYNGSSWETIGVEGFSGNMVKFATEQQLAFVLDAQGTPYVAYLDADNNRPAVMKYNGSAWVMVGAESLSQLKGGTPSLALDASGTPHIAYRDDLNVYRATVKKFNGEDWETVGVAGFSAGSIDYPTLVFDPNNMPYVAYKDQKLATRATVMRFDGSQWNFVGAAAFTDGIASYLSLKIDTYGTPYLAYQEGGNLGKATLMKFNGTSWEVVGAKRFSSGHSYSVTLTLDEGGTPFVAYDDYGATPTIMRYNGSEWEPINRTGIDSGEKIFFTMNAQGTPYIALRDYSNSGKAVVMKFAARPNSAPTNIAISSASVNENVAANTVVGSFTTTDADAGNTHTYTLVSGTGSIDNSNFVIDGTSLKIAVSPDYETKNSYSIRVKTDDSQGGTFEKPFTITVVNVNEAPTAFALSKSDINENNQAGAEVGTLSSTDPDANDSHTYALVSGNGATDNAAFSIQGNVLKATVSFDYETKSSYSIRVRTSDVGGLAFESVKVISINDVQEVVTSLAEGEYEALQVYPNPASHTIMISTDYVIDNVSLVNAYGSTVLVKKGGTKQVQLNVDSVSPGVYTAIINSNGKTYIRRIVVTK